MCRLVLIKCVTVRIPRLSILVTLHGGCPRTGSDAIVQILDKWMKTAANIIVFDINDPTSRLGLHYRNCGDS